MPISAVDTISLAIEHTKQQAFKPFRLGQWTRLAVAGLLAGELSSGGCNFSNFNPAHHPGAHSPFPSISGIDFALLGGLVATLIITGFVLGLILTYISSVMRFVLFDSILGRECHIREFWSRRQGPGWQYFLWKLVYVFATAGGLAILVGVPIAFAFAVGWLPYARDHAFPLVLSAILLAFGLMIYAVLAGIVFVLTKDFVIPQMALEGINAFEGWRRLWPMMRAEMGAYAGYIGMKIALAIATGIVVGIATLILGLMIAIPTIGLGVLAIVTGKSAGLTWNAYTITLAVVVGSILLAFFLYLVSLISVPVIVFFPAYSIYFFAGRYQPLSAVLHPAPPSPAMIPPPAEAMPPSIPPYPGPTG